MEGLVSLRLTSPRPAELALRASCVPGSPIYHRRLRLPVAWSGSPIVGGGPGGRLVVFPFPPGAAGSLLPS